MTTTISLAKPKSSAPASIWPQVDLLPPEVRAGRRLKRTKRLLGLGILGIVLLAVLGWASAQLQLRDANQQVADVQAETTRLTAEQAKYSEVPQIQRELQRVDGDIAAATQTEVLWKQYLEAIRAVTPDAVALDTLQVAMVTDPTQNASMAPLQAASVGQITFTAHATTLPDISAWMDAVRSVPGLSDPWFTQATLGSQTDANGGNAVVSYQVSGTVQVTSTALAHRFASTAAPADTPFSPAATPTATPTSGSN